MTTPTKEAVVEAGRLTAMLPTKSNPDYPNDGQRYEVDRGSLAERLALALDAFAASRLDALAKEKVPEAVTLWFNVAANRFAQRPIQLPDPAQEFKTIPAPSFDALLAHLAAATARAEKAEALLAKNEGRVKEIVDEKLLRERDEAVALLKSTRRQLVRALSETFDSDGFAAQREIDAFLHRLTPPPPAASETHTVSDAGRRGLHIDASVPSEAELKAILDVASAKCPNCGTPTSAAIRALPDEGGAVEAARRAFYLAAREWIRCARLSDEKADDETDEQMDELAGTTARSFDKVDETYDALVKAEAEPDARKEG